MSDHDSSIMAYRRDNGRVGVRNHVVILPVDDISNAACEAVANKGYEGFALDGEPVPPALHQGQPVFEVARLMAALQASHAADACAISPENENAGGVA